MLNLNLKVESPCEESPYISTECLDKITLEILPSKLNQYQNNIIWYYDIEERSCKPIASECIDLANQNRFRSQQDCASQCIPNVNEIQSEGMLIFKLFDRMSIFFVNHDYSVDCLLPIDVGNKCNLQIWRWYYDAKAGVCNLFSYSGCHGNNNNFPSSKSCLWLCSTVGN